jgi:16S rRNA (guanine966-N2)-methyltransferase
VLFRSDGNPGWLSGESWAIVQIHPREYQKLELKNLEEFEERKYGSTLLLFYEKKNAD